MYAVSASYSELLESYEIYATYIDKSSQFKTDVADQYSIC